MDILLLARISFYVRAGCRIICMQNWDCLWPFGLFSLFPCCGQLSSNNTLRKQSRDQEDLNGVRSRTPETLRTVVPYIAIKSFRHELQQDFHCECKLGIPENLHGCYSITVTSVYDLVTTISNSPRRARYTLQPTYIPFTAATADLKF